MARFGLKTAAAGAAAVIAGFSGKAIVKGVALLAGFGAFHVAEGYFGTPEELRAFEAGFGEVSEDLEGWNEVWADTTDAQFQLWGAWVVAAHLTEDEAIDVYRVRSDAFSGIADDPELAPFCTEGALTNRAIDLDRLGIDSVEMARAIGIGLARRHVGQQWVPPVDLMVDEEAWFDFFDYLDATGHSGVADGLIEMGDPLTPPDYRKNCLTQATLFGLASERSDDLAGDVRVLDFVRSMEVAGLEAGL